MWAAVMHDFGGPEVLHYEDVPTPTAGPGEILMRIEAVSVNRTLDMAVRAGTYHIKPALPHVLGTDPSGIVAEIGEGVENPRVGQRVAAISPVRCGTCQNCRSSNSAACQASQHLGVSRWGGYAEYVAIPASNPVLIPDNLAFPEASVIIRHFPTAFHLLRGRAQLQPGEWVLVMGAAGALGSCLVQVGKLLGAQVVAAAGSDERVQSCLVHGADFGVNYRREDLAAEVMRLTDGRGVDVVAENIGDASLWPGAFNSLAFQGRLVTAGAHGGDGIVPLDVRRLYLRRLQIIGSPGSNRADLDSALEAARAGRIHAVIGRNMPLAQAAEAHRLLERNAVIGKVVLQPPSA